MHVRCTKGSPVPSPLRPSGVSDPHSPCRGDPCADGALLVFCVVLPPGRESPITTRLSYLCLNFIWCKHTVAILWCLILLVSHYYYFLSFLQVGMCTCSWFFLSAALLCFLYDYNRGPVIHATLGGHLDYLRAWLSWRMPPGPLGTSCFGYKGAFAGTDVCVFSTLVDDP